MRGVSVSMGIKDQPSRGHVRCLGGTIQLGLACPQRSRACRSGAVRHATKWEPDDYVYLVLVLLVGMSEDIGTLNGLREETEDVVNYQNGILCVLWAGSVCLHAIARVQSASAGAAAHLRGTYMVM